MAAGEPAQAVRDAESQRIAVMAKAKDAVVSVFAASGQGGGSGVVITPDGFVLTNFHVAQPCGISAQCGMADGNVYDAVLVGLDPTGDVAVLKLFGRDTFPCATMADSDQVRAGDPVFAMGNPFLLATDLQPTVTDGIVSGLHRYQPPAGTLLEYTDCIQTDVSINPGNSGGPLFDAQGHVIGIVGRCSFEKRGRVNVGGAYAISINQIKNFLGSLRGGNIVDHATLGARLGSDADGRIVVTEINEGSDAYRRGLRYDDEVITFAGRPVTSANEYKNVLGILPKGWRVPLSYRRDGQRYDILVRLAGVHREEELWENATRAQQPAPIPIPKPDEEPKPLDQPKPGEPKPSPDRRPDLAPRLGKLPHGKTTNAKPPIPEIVAKHYQEKHGFANYYFNRLNQERVWKAWTTHALGSDFAGKWLLSGQLGSGGGFRFELTDAGATLDLPSSSIPWTAEDDFSTSLLPPQSGGLLPALYLMRRLAVEGLDRFGEVQYYGQVPLPGHEGLVDLLRGTHKGVECRFFTDPNDGRLLAMEMSPDDETDPCEIYFSDFRPLNGGIWPGRMEVRYGNEPFATFQIRECSFEK